MTDIVAYAALFAVAFGAATLLPLQSEALLATLLVTSGLMPAVLIAVASAGNVLGSCLNWWLGIGIERLKDKKWFPVRETTLVRAQEYYRRYGRWSLLLSWVPFIGDPLTIMAGVLREKFIVFLLIVTVAKTGRYMVIWALVAEFQ